jgi:hypothetical protein
MSINTFIRTLVAPTREFAWASAMERPASEFIQFGRSASAKDHVAGRHRSGTRAKEVWRLAIRALVTGLNPALTERRGGRFSG